MTNILKIVRDCLGLLNRRDRFKLALIVVAQMATGFLDLAGVLLLGLVGVLAASAASGGSMPSPVETLVDSLGLSDVNEIDLAAWLCLLAGMCLILKSLASAFLTRRTFRFLALRQAAVSGELTAALLTRPLVEIQRRASQDIAFVITIATQSATVGVLGAATTGVADMTLLLVLGFGLTAIDPMVSVFAVIFFGVLSLALQRFLSGRARNIGKESAEIDIQAYQAIQEAISGYREITVASRRRFYVEKIQKLRWRAANLNADSQFIVLIPKYVFEIALVVGALALAISQVASKSLIAAVGVVAVFLVAGARIMPAVMRVQVASLSIRQAEAPAAKALALWKELKEPQVRAGKVDDESLEWRAYLESDFVDFVPSIEVSDVEVRYSEGSDPAIAGVSFTVAPGTSVALVGATGSGKSTLADVILGIVEPDRGWVTIGGLEPIQAASRWPGGIAYVPQEVAVLNASIRENVAIGLPPAAVDDDQVWRALDQAEIGDLLRSEREGLDTHVGERGTKLSGGQRQRLGLARALFSQPKLLVLDEATSALDAATERTITQSLERLEGSVTLLTIAHRISTIQRASKIIFLSEGQIAASGSFDELRSKLQAFDRLARLSGL